MTPDRIKALEAAGYRVGTVAEFLELTPEQAMRVEEAAAKLTAELGVEASEKEEAINKAPRTRRFQQKIAVPQ